MAAQEDSSVIHIGKKEIKVVINHARKCLFPGSCFVLGHGASGDAASGNLPLIAKALSESSLMVLRYTCYGQLPARVKVLQASLLSIACNSSPQVKPGAVRYLYERLQGILDSNHSALSSIKHWVLSGHSMVRHYRETSSLCITSSSRRACTVFVHRVEEQLARSQG